MHLFPNLQTNNRSEAHHKIELYKLVNNVKRSKCFAKGLISTILERFRVFVHICDHFLQILF